MSCDSLKARLVSTKRPFSFETGTVIDYSVSAKYFPDGLGYNLVGIVEGSDPILKKECIVIGAHADHCGQFKSMIFPGADDNASGTAVVMEIGRIFASLKVKPKRSIIVALFGAEEMGSKGSGFFSTHIPEQCSKVIGMLNFDMVGEGDGAECVYSTPELKNILVKANVDAGILRNSRPMEKIGMQSSDFAPFVTQGIPSISFSSNGPHLSYHQSGDTLYRLNPEIMADIAVLGFRTAYLLANEE
jgi:Zn-dependent M28 family amino/carboxypeptidase